MKIFTQREVDAVQRDENGRLNYPTGDYAAFNSFGEMSSFGEGSSFGEWSSFGEGASFGEWSSFGEGSRFGEGCQFEGKGKAKDGYPLLSFGGFGSENRTTYAFNLESGIWIRCGCYLGTLEEFRAQVTKTHNDNQFAREYLAIADLIQMKWEGE